MLWLLVVLLLGPAFGWPVTVNNAIVSDDLANASAVFNTVNNVLRQKNSDLNPNGMSIVPAIVPPGTPLYHSTNKPGLPQNPEWIAFDAEFSYNFGSGFGWGKRPPGVKDPKKPGKVLGFHDQSDIQSERSFRPLHDPSLPMIPYRDVYLLTFTPVEPLKVLVLDGASAAKDNSGMMDSQVLLANGTYDQYYWFSFRDERPVAAKICEWGQPFGLDAVVRLEIGFEMFVCDFGSPKLTLSRNSSLTNMEDNFEWLSVSSHGVTTDLNRILRSMTMFEHFEAGSTHYSKERRILLDLSNLITPLGRTYIPPDPYTRRIANLSDEIKAELVSKTENALLHLNQSTAASSVDWQTVTDTVVERFTPILQRIGIVLQQSRADESEEHFIYTLSNLTALSYHTTRRFHDAAIVDTVERRMAALKAVGQEYAGLFPLTTESDRLISESIALVATHIASHIFEIFDYSILVLEDLHRKGALDKSPVRKHLQDFYEKHQHLVKFLRWSSFVDCQDSCGPDQICFIPVWGPSPLPFEGRLGTKDCQCLDVYTLIEKNKSW